MRCQGCGYALWNLPEPRCPECGRAFDLREYVFRAGTVKFACPRCGELREGVGERHLPSTSDRAFCDACRLMNPVTAMRVVPLVDPPVEAELRDKSDVPWETFIGDVGGRVLMRRWFATFKLVIGSPSALARRFRADSGVADSIQFALVSWVIGPLLPLVLVAVGGMAIVIAFGLSTAGGGGASSLTKALSIYFILLIIGFLLSAIGVLLGFVAMFIAVVCPAHLFLIATGGTRGNHERSYRALMYGQAWFVFLPISTVMTPIGWGVVYLCFIFSASRMLAEHQGVPLWRAVLSLFVGPVVCLVLFGLMWQMSYL